MNRSIERHSDSTPDHLLDVAERLFAEEGPEAVSLRRINDAAGLNPAAVHYHFGSREKLLEAIVLRRMTNMMERRSRLIGEIDAGERPSDVHNLARVLILPLAELLLEAPEAGRRYLRLLAHVYVSGSGAVHALIETHFSEGMRHWFHLLGQALPEVPRPVLRARVDLMADSVIHGLAKLPAKPARGQLAPPAYVAALIDTVAGALAAPVHLTSIEGDLA